MKETITMSDAQPAEYSIMDLVLAYRAHRDSLKRYKQQHKSTKALTCSKR